MEWKSHLGSIACAALALNCVQAQAKPPAKAIVGPGLLCLKYSTLSLIEGERVARVSLGGEDMSITIKGPRGRFVIREGEVWAPIEGEKEFVSERDQTRIYRLPRGAPIYAVYGSAPFLNGQDKPIIWLSGTALKGTAKDADIYSRIMIRDPEGADCLHGFTYSWNFQASD